MIRVAHLGDSHWDETSRWDECVRVHNWIADDLDRRGVDLVLHGGDIYERASTPRERAGVVAWLQRVASRCPVVVVRGNHDRLHDLAILGEIRAEYPIIVEERSGVHVVETAGGETVAVGCLAWPRRAELLARSGSHEQTELLASAALRGVLGGLGAALASHELPRILLAHAMVRGSRTTAGQPLVGQDMELGLEDLIVGADVDVVCLAHIHCGQDWDGPVVYPGSPYRTAYGEVEPKGYVIYQFGAGRDGLISWERVETPAQPMVLLHGVYYSGGGLDVLDVPGVTDVPGLDAVQAGADVRLRYDVDADQRDAARTAAAELRDIILAAGAAKVKLEEQVRVASVARAPEVAAALTIAAKLEALWAARGWDPGDRREALLSRLRELEEAG